MGFDVLELLAVLTDAVLHLEGYLRGGAGASHIRRLHVLVCDKERREVG